MRKIMCFLLGHQPVKGLYETDKVICDTGCQRCNAPIFNRNTYWKKIRDCPPPGNTNLAKWHQFCENEQHKLRGLYYKPTDLGKRAIAFSQKQAGRIVSVLPHGDKNRWAGIDYVTIDTGLTLHRHYFFIEGENNTGGKLFEEHKKEFFK